MKRCYQTKINRNVGLILVAVFGFATFHIIFLEQPNRAHHLPAAVKAIESVIALLVYGFILLRVAPAGVYPGAEGIKVRNPLHTDFIPWTDVKGFSLHESSRWSPRPMGRVDKRAGTSIRIFGIQANNLGERAAQRAVDELNALLEARRREELEPDRP